MAEDFVLRDMRLPMVMNSRGYPAPAEDFDVDEQNIRNVLLTTPGERLNRPLFGSFLVRMVHKNMSTRLFLLVLAEIRRAVRSHLPELVVLGVDFEVNDSGAGNKRVIATIEWDRRERALRSNFLRKPRVTSIELSVGNT